MRLQLQVTIVSTAHRMGCAPGPLSYLASPLFDVFRVGVKTAQRLAHITPSNDNADDNVSYWMMHPG